MSAQEIQKFSQRFKASDLPGAAVHPDVVVSGVPESPSCNTSSESQDPNTQRDVISSKISSSTLSILKGSLSSGLAQEEEGGLQDTRAGNDEVDGGVVQEIMAKAASQDWEGGKRDHGYYCNDHNKRRVRLFRSARAHNNSFERG